MARVWSLNRTRRHLSPSQAALADARRNQMSDVYAKLRQDAKARQAEAVALANKARHEPAPLGELIPPMEPDKPAPKTRDLRAEAAGTNAKYIDLADKIVAEHPEMAKEIEAGKLTLSQAKRAIKKEQREAAVVELSKTVPSVAARYQLFNRPCIHALDLAAGSVSFVITDPLGSSFKCNTQRPEGIGCCDGQTKQAPQQRGTWRDFGGA